MEGSCDVDSCVVCVWCWVCGSEMELCVNVGGWLLVECVCVLGGGETVLDVSLVFIVSLVFPLSFDARAWVFGRGSFL